MRMVTLIENSQGVEGCLFEHGLSIYAEVGSRKVLFDTGASAALIKNAELLGINLRSADMVVLSHGHWDHAGGITALAELNGHAPIYAQAAAALDYYSGDRYIGIDKKILELPQLRLRRGSYIIEEGISVFAGVTERRCWPKGNLSMTCCREGVHTQDDFAHEQYLVLEENGQRVLLSGCAHNGILNIMRKFTELYGGEPDVVVSGFHMMQQNAFTESDKEIIKATAEELAGTKSVFYTGHCTGQPAFEIMQAIMGSKLQPLYTGKIIC